MTDIYAIEAKMKSVVEFLEQKAEEGTKVYRPTRIRLEGLLNQCNEAIDLITTILQDSILEDDSEFDNKSESVSDILDGLYQVANKFEEFLGKPNIVDKQEDITSNKKDLSKSDKKSMLLEYSNAIDNLVENVSGSQIGYLRECSFIIQQWFEARYKSGVTEFKYDVKTIPRWIRGIVISYTQSIQENSVQTFTTEFFDWIDRIDEDPTYSTYPLPYNIYINSNTATDKSASLMALVLWDLLYDNGLKELCGCQVPIQKIQMKNVFGRSKLSENKIAELKRHKDYSSNSDILYESGLLNREDGEENV